MKLTILLGTLVLSLFAFSSLVYAAPNPDNPNVVAYYENGAHTIPIPGQPSLNGYDLVMRNGNSGNFNQWFWNDEIGYHSVWNMTKNGECNNGYLIPNAYPGWGDYLVPGAEYCVITNTFHP